MFGQIGATHTKLCRSHNQEGKRQLTLVCAEKKEKGTHAKLRRNQSGREGGRGGVELTRREPKELIGSAEGSPVFTPILGNWEELMNGNGEELMNGNEEDEWQLGRVDEGQWGGVDQRQRHGHGERGDEQGRDVVAAPPSESRPVNRGDASVAKELDNEGMWSKIYYVVGPRSERCSKRWSMVSSKIWPRDGHKVSIPTPHPLSNLLPLGLRLIRQLD